MIGGNHLTTVAAVGALVLALVGGSVASGETPALRLRVTIPSAADVGALTIALSRWSTDAEREPLLAALAAPPPTSAPPPSAAAPAGRGRGRGAPPPPSPLAKLSSAIKAAPTLGYIWTDGVTGYSIKYAWRSPATEDKERIVLVTDRRMSFREVANHHRSVDYPFTVIELRLQKSGEGEGKVSVATKIIPDKDSKVVTLENYDIQPVLLTKVTRESVTH